MFWGVITPHLLFFKNGNGDLSNIWVGVSKMNAALYSDCKNDLTCLNFSKTVSLFSKEHFSETGGHGQTPSSSFSHTLPRLMQASDFMPKTF